MRNSRVFSEFEFRNGNSLYDVHPLVMMLQGGESDCSFEPEAPAFSDDSRLNRFAFLDATDGGYIDVGAYVSELRKAQDELNDIDIEQFVKDTMDADEEKEDAIKEARAAFDRYLIAFFDISKEVVFSKKNANLYYSGFRNSDFLEALVETGATKKAGKEEKEEDFYQFSFKNPISLYTLARVLSNLKYFEEKERDEKGRVVYQLRKSVFMDSVLSAFKRYFYVDGRTYRVNLSRHYNYLTAYPYEHLSSTEEVKPVRLLEKVAAYIRNEVQKITDGELNVNITLIGHTEPSQDGQIKRYKRPRGLIDFVASVLNWYRTLTVNDLPKLQLKVINYVSETDWPPSNSDVSEDDLKGTIEWYNNCATYEIKKIKTEDTFGFNTNTIAGIIRDNHIVFLLDCPWLSTENYQLAEEVMLETFCEQLKSKNIIEEINQNTRFADDVHSIYANTTFDTLGVQYNRIMASATMRSGKIVRTMRETLIKRIIDLFFSQNEKKKREDGRRRLLYIFSSEKEGVVFSGLYSSLLAREEKYDGRTHLIAELDTDTPKQLSLKKMNLDEKLHFHINLWGILKYISVSFAYTGFEELVREKLGEINEEMAIDFLELYRSICADFEISSDFRKINIRVLFKPDLDKCIMELAPKADVEKAKKEIHKLVCDLLEPLYCQSVFRNNRRYGDDAIKTAFKMNLYSSVEEAHLMLFLHRYSVLAADDKLDEYFSVSFSRDYPMPVEKSFADDFKGKDHFMDRRLYEFLLSYLERGREPTLPLRSMFYEADEHTGWKDSLNRVLSNIISACKDVGETGTLLYKTALKIQREG